MEPIASTDIVNRLGTVVRRTRKAQNLTQAQLASKAHVSRNFLIGLEDGHQRAEIGKVFAVITALGVDPKAKISIDEIITVVMKTPASAAEQVKPKRSGRATVVGNPKGKRIVKVKSRPAKAEAKAPAAEKAAPAPSKEDSLALIEKGQQLAGHFPSKEALDRAQRLLDGSITREEGLRELDAKYKRA
ncbi:helix-turn-helix domain-containing protein [Microbacterium sp. PAMC22086]|uniref:helix-turn-helix domain-containing protein n=1 Tax=Microbacterium sp. PAMC22086 TaxID=2861281 RepID=UPI001C631000|nr:helix-turn-helix domain-containing protein [Microbacterium sp. PAMC22086]QYG10954.1 helix-turn-helix domain-containing protein [Microbacterium sp. PAMC22086]